MRHTEFWARMEAAMGESYAHFWADQHVPSELGGRTETEALLARWYGGNSRASAVRTRPPHSRATRAAGAPLP